MQFKAQNIKTGGAQSDMCGKQLLLTYNGTIATASERNPEQRVKQKSTHIA